MSFNLATMLRESAATWPDKVLVHSGESSFTFAEVDELSGRVAASLTGLGLEPGDKVAVQLPNLPQFLFAYFGILKAGLTMVPLNPLLTAPEVAYHLTDSDTKILVTFAGFAEAALAGAERAGGVTPYVVIPEGAPLPADARDFTELLAGEGTGALHPTSSDDTAVLLYTSGTTGKPKGAELTHFQLYMNCTIAGKLFEVTSADVSLGVLPLFHVFGLSSVLNNAVRFGATLVLTARFAPDDVLDLIERHRITVFLGVPTMYFALLQADTAGRDLSSIRAGVSGGASIPGEVIRSFEQKFPGVVILEGYGLSETASTATFNINAEQRRVLSVGKPIWGIDMEVRGEDGATLPPGSDNVGEIVIRGHNVMKGYYGRPEATAEAIRDGWFPLRRPGLPRRGRLLLRGRPAQGPDHPRRLQRLPARGGGGALRAPGRRRGRRHRQGRRAPRRGGGRLRRPAAGRDGDGRRHHRALQGTARGVQVPAGDDRAR
jgi:long-chain acyl-CoA synthetase